MNKKVLIVEDQFVEAHDLQLMLEKAGYEVCGIARSVPVAQEIIKEEKPDLVLLDIYLKGELTGIHLAEQLKDQHVAFIFLSANSNEDVLSAAKTTAPGGFIVKPYREKDLLTTLEIARYRHEHSMESYFRMGNILKEKLSAITAGQEEWQTKLMKICIAIQPYVSFDFVTAGFNSVESSPATALGYLRIGYDEYQGVGIEELLTVAKLKLSELIRLSENTPNDSIPSKFVKGDFEQIVSKVSLHKLFADVYGVNSVVSLPLYISGHKSYIFNFYSRESDIYTSDHIALLNLLQSSMARCIGSILNEAKKELNVVVIDDNDQLEDSSVTQKFAGVIGGSHLLLNVLDRITTVAPFDTSVLILGESGTGKERIAQCIHDQSARRAKTMVKVNCAALPPNLIESELFGHEKGSFTGAINKRVGKFEQANGSTIFLDEIGELPLDMQVKFLRVLQEKEIESIGSRTSVKVDVRVVAATNRNLEKEVADGRFRLDLYYRLNVFPILVPSLRSRTEDIPALIRHFVARYNKKSGKKIHGVSEKVLKSMLIYDWPGNIRELENFIERGVLLAKGPLIDELDFPVVRSVEARGIDIHFPFKTMLENERDYIVAVLKKCKGRIWGAGGAAEALDVPPSTLKSKMKKLGIPKEY